MPKDRAWYDKRQKMISKKSQEIVARALEVGESYSDPAERSYFLGGTGVSILTAAYLHVSHDVGGEAADEWLREQIRGVVLILNDLCPRKVRITFNIEPADGLGKEPSEHGR